MSLQSIILAIETSQRCGAVALRDADGVIDTEPLAPSGRHDDDLLAAIDRLYRRRGVEASRTLAVGVSIGPGGFTGLRLAVSTAKMLAVTLDAKIVAVASALVAAEAHAGPGPIIVTLAAKRGTVWATRLERDTSGVWSIDGESGIVDAIEPGGVATVVADEHLPGPMRVCCDRAGVPVVPPTFDAGACLRVADRQLQAGRCVDPMTLCPLYARPPEAVTIWERRHG